jgi:hypothetical protein
MVTRLNPDINWHLPILATPIKKLTGLKPGKSLNTCSLIAVSVLMDPSLRPAF